MNGFPARQRAGSTRPRPFPAFLSCFRFKLMEGLQPVNWEVIRFLGLGRPGCHREVVRDRCDFYFLITLLVICMSPWCVRRGERRQGGDGRAGSLRSGEGGSLGSETARVPELDRGKESGSVIKCARAATQAGERTRPGICRSTLL